MPRYIDADKLIARFREIAGIEWNKTAVPACWSDAYEQFIDELEEADAEDVAPVSHAHWEVLGETKPFMVECSRCGYGHPISDHLRYCHKCGAKMDEVQDGADE